MKLVKYAFAEAKKHQYTLPMEQAIHPRSIVILDFGGQYAHLIARRVRQCGVYSEILPPETPASLLSNAAGIILSGGPQSVYDEGSPQADPKMLELGIPVLGLCYGLHWMTHVLGGKVQPGSVKEYGRAKITMLDGGGALLKDCGDSCIMWMSHGDEAVELPEGFHVTATSEDCAHAAFENADKKLFALQFHPEVTHSEHGFDVLKRFVDVCHAAEWSIESYTSHVSSQIRHEVGDRSVFMLVSGGVDSTVAFTLLNQVLGHDRVVGLMIDTGLMRKNEISLMQQAFEKLGITNLHVEDASEEFFANLKNMYEPEQKRKIIGDTFLAVQKRVADQMKISMDDDWMLGQGTIYPDTIETGGTKHADKIKTHHNRVPAIQKMIEEGRVIEPLKELYKDEVRTLGEELGLPHELVWRHPFPGPGLGVRILCTKGELRSKNDELRIDIPHQVLPIQSVGVQGDGRTYRHAVVLYGNDETLYRDLATTIPNRNKELNRVLMCLSHSSSEPFVVTPGYLTRERADLLREADVLVDEEMRAADLYQKIWQFPVVLLPVGLKLGGQSIVLRPIESQEAMTATALPLPASVLKKMTERLLALDGIDAVFLDLTSKPPATIEWE